MSLLESLSSLTKKLEELSTITEDKGHLDHPEDLVFLSDISGAQRALKAITDTVKIPKAVTIKWDGYPALIFGRGTNKKFTIMDKHMFNKKDGTGRVIYSPEQFVEYDKARGVDRSGLHQLMFEIWPGLEKASKGTVGYYWGDLLFSKPLKEKNGVYTFRANPNGITYVVDPDSELGKLMAGKAAGIAVHQFIPADAVSTDYAQSLNGTIGQLTNNSNVAIVPSAMPNVPKLKLDSNLVNDVKKAIATYGKDVQQLMTTAPQARSAFNGLFTTYINKKIVNGDLNNLVQGFYDYFNSRPMTDDMRKKLAQHLEQNKNGVLGVFAIWVALYQLKMSLVNQLNTAAEDSPVQGYLQDGTPTQEGFVSQGLKFIDRMGFSRQNLQGR